MSGTATATDETLERAPPDGSQLPNVPETLRDTNASGSGTDPGNGNDAGGGGGDQEQLFVGEGQRQGNASIVVEIPPRLPDIEAFADRLQVRIG